MKFLGITVDFKFTFQKHIEEILGCYNTRYHRIRLLVNKISPIAGVPQGSVLHPLLFLIYVNDLPNPHHRQNWKSQFADDTSLWTASKNVQFAAKLLCKDLQKLAKWCAKCRIKLNPEKPRSSYSPGPLSPEIHNSF